MDPLRSLVDAVERAASAQELLAATRALAQAVGPGADPAGIASLVRVLGFNNPGAAVAAVDGLITVGADAVEPLLLGLDEHNYGARAWAVRALAGIGDVRGLSLLEQALGQDIGPSVRRAAARGLGQLRLATLPLGERRDVRERCLVALEQGREDGEWVVRYAVAVALEGLGAPLERADPHGQRALENLRILGHPEREPTPVVRLRAGLALTRLGEP
ncbi:MAG: phycocyanin alpha phycocyanobilin lyase [Cyanobium sp. CACIAM 14]|nr:MAG: phycocyanin alpha phycocyanobilin lyase [Cyanobium sp. CACIAM 14]